MQKVYKNTFTNNIIIVKIYNTILLNQLRLKLLQKIIKLQFITLEAFHFYQIVISILTQLVYIHTCYKITPYIYFIPKELNKNIILS
jgi:hypothetical protein